MSSPSPWGAVLACCLLAPVVALASDSMNVEGPGCDDPVGHLVCEAEHVQDADPRRASVLLGEALDKQENMFLGRVELYSRFAKLPTLNLPVLRFLKSRNLDQDRGSFALSSQIWQGNVENVRQLLELGADPNEHRGNQNEALSSAREALRKHP